MRTDDARGSAELWAGVVILALSVPVLLSDAAIGAVLLLLGVLLIVMRP